MNQMRSKLYGKLKNGKIVRVAAWIADMDFDDPLNEVYFYARGKDKYIFGKQLKWTYRNEFIGFSKSKRKLKKVK
jgi:hypothetical protein